MAVASKTWSVGEVVTAGNMNTYIRDNLADLQSNKVVINTGTYTGDGTTGQAITGVGFTPIYLKVWQQVADQTDCWLWETTTDIMAFDADGLAYNNHVTEFEMQDNALISLDADGFTVDDDGADNPPNTNAAVYFYLALGAE